MSKKQTDTATEKTGGKIEIHESVIASIVRRTALMQQGVVRLAGSTLMDNIAELIGSKAVQGRAISIEIGNKGVAVDLRIVLEYGIYIPTVTADLQNSIAQAVTEHTGMKVTKVNITVIDLEEKTTEEKPE